MTLLDYLSCCDANQRFLYGARGWMSAGETCRHARCLRGANSSLSGRGAIIRGTNDEKIILGLLAFDGFAESVLLIGGEISDEQVTEFGERCGIKQVADLFVPESDEEFIEVSDALKTRWIVPTSGTTGTPKLVEHSLASLGARVQRDRSKGAEFVWGMIYDVTRFAGLQVLLQSVIGGSGLAVVDDRRDITSMASRFAAADVNALSATPTMWRKLVMLGVLENLNLKTITLGGEAADQKILDELRRRFSRAKLTTIYASTEAGVGFAVVDDKAGFPASYIEKDLPAGTELRVEKGRLYIRKAIPSAVYVGDDTQITDEDGWIDTGDLVDLNGDRFYFMGRENGSINVGGQKVHPTEVERVIQALPGVEMVAVLGRRNPIMGSVVEAHVVPALGVAGIELKRQILQACLDQLLDYKVPASIKIVDQIPLTAVGKIKRNK